MLGATADFVQVLEPNRHLPKKAVNTDLSTGCCQLCYICDASANGDVSLKKTNYAPSRNVTSSVDLHRHQAHRPAPSAQKPSGSMVRGAVYGHSPTETAESKIMSQL